MAAVAGLAGGSHSLRLTGASSHQDAGGLGLMPQAWRVGGAVSDSTAGPVARMCGAGVDVVGFTGGPCSYGTLG